MSKDFWTIHRKIKESQRPKIHIDQISNLFIREKLCSANLCTYMIIIFQRKYLGKSMLIMMMSTLLALLAWTFKIPLHHMWVVPHLASWPEARKAIHSSNLSLVSSWEKREKIGRKNHETKCFFAIKPAQIIWDVLTPPKVFRVRANSKSKSLTRQLSLNFHKTRF